MQLIGAIRRLQQDAWVLFKLKEALKMNQVGINNGFWFNF